MRSEKSDHQNAIYVLNQGNQPKIVGFDIENHTTTLQDARLRMRFLHLIRRLPSAVSAIASQASYCARAALIPL
jgi:hypothetical protein